MTGTDPTAQRFNNRVAQIALAAFGGLLVALGLAGLAASAGSAAVYVLVGGFTVARGLHSSCVLVDGSTVTTRSMVRTRRYPFSELRDVEVVVGRTGLAVRPREYLLLCSEEGGDIPFKALNCAPPEGVKTTSAVRRAAACIRERLAADRTSTT